MKPQAVRLVDVFLLAPFMIWAAGYLPRPGREIMLAAGVATALYNWRNYTIQRDALAANPGAQKALSHES